MQVTGFKLSATILRLVFIFWVAMFLSVYLYTFQNEAAH